MKYLFLLIFLPFIVFAQERYIGELRIDLTNYGSSFNITFTLTSIGARWDENYNLTENYENASDVVSSYPYYATFDHVLDPSNVNDTFAVGLYKISAIENDVEQAMFYCDWRTSNWDSCLDVTFKYDVINERFRNSENTQTIDYSYQTLWELTANLLETSGLEDFWDNALCIMEQDNHPLLAWGTHPTMDTLAFYNIYKMNEESQFEVYDTTSQNWYVDTAENIVTGPHHANERYASYKITAEDNYAHETDFSNMASIRVEGEYTPPENRGREIPSETISQNKIASPMLFSNYPNPFNPSTTIAFSLPRAYKIKITIYSITGEKVTELIDGYAEMGFHTVKWNGRDQNGHPVSTGIYLYELMAGSHRKVGKMFLVR